MIRRSVAKSTPTKVSSFSPWIGPRIGENQCEYPMQPFDCAHSRIDFASAFANSLSIGTPVARHWASA